MSTGKKYNTFSVEQRIETHECMSFVVQNVIFTKFKILNNDDDGDVDNEQNRG